MDDISSYLSLNLQIYRIKSVIKTQKQNRTSIKCTKPTKALD